MVAANIVWKVVATIMVSHVIFFHFFQFPCGKVWGNPSVLVLKFRRNDLYIAVSQQTCGTWRNNDEHGIDGKTTLTMQQTTWQHHPLVIIGSLQRGAGMAGVH